MEFQAIFSVPFGKLGIHCSEQALLGIAFLPASHPPQAPRLALARAASEQLQAYLRDPAFLINLPYELNGSPHQCRVWQALREIPVGSTCSYGELARRLGSSAQAVGQACGHNPLPLVLPCHRVVSKRGLGGFMQGTTQSALEIKRWLLHHERR